MSLESKIESLLFISGRPMSLRELSGLLKIESKEVEEVCGRLLLAKKEGNFGTQVIKNGANYQMVTAPDNAEIIQEFVKDETTGELGRPSLETLTIIAYRGPVSKIDLDRIRGVNCSMIIHNLLMRGLIEGKENKKTEEVYYTVTFDFLKFLGLNEIKELPDYERLSADDTIDRILAEEGEDKTTENLEKDVNISELKPTEEMTEEQKEAVLEEALEVVVGEDVSGAAPDILVIENSENLDENKDELDEGDDDDEYDEEDEDDDLEVDDEEKNN